MKIGFISTYFYPFIGGAEANCYNIAKKLSKNHEIHIFTSDRKDKHIVLKREEKLNNKIFVHRSKTIFRYKYYFGFYPEMLIKLLKQDLDILQVHSLGFIWHDICIIIKKIMSPKTKFIITPHGPFMALKSYPLWQIILKKIVELFEKRINGIYDLVIQVNPYQYKWLKDYNFKQEKITYIPNGINKEIFKNSNKSNFLKKYNLKNKFIISYIGRIHEYKGIQNVLKVLPEIVKIKKNLVFIIMGQDAGYLSEIKSQIKKLKIENSVKILENVSEIEKLECLEASEIFIMPSEWEAFGITILEAMSKRNAIISTETEGGKFLVSEENGLLYKFKDIKKLELNLTKLTFDKNLREHMQRNNLMKSKEFTWDKISENIEKEYKKLR